MRFCGKKKDGTPLLLTDEKIIENALEQERQGIKPHYAFYDYKKQENITPPGWPVCMIFVLIPLNPVSILLFTA